MGTTYLASKPRYEILDGLRGVAAMIVVAFHLTETYYEGQPIIQPINHGYLAVDFFFVLSGFVIGYAYDDRWNRMTTWQFFKRRLIRLHPMLVFGTLFGMTMFYFQSDLPSWQQVGETPWWLLVVVCIWGFTLIPAPKCLDIRGWGEMHPLNNAQWSLLWEYIANILYALVIRRFSHLLLAIFVGCSAILTIMLCMNIDPLGLLAIREYAAYTVIGGWSLDPEHLLIAVTRLFYPFFCGLLISRMFTDYKGLGSRLRFKASPFALKGGFWWCGLFVALLLVMPRVGGYEPSNYWENGLYEAVCILVLFPLIVTVGAASKVKGTRSVAVCKLLGEISYPLYVTHYPLIYVQMSWAASHADLPASTHFFMAVCLFMLAIGISYASLKLYDLPVREWLKNHLFQ
ncbi:MAG: acyltransferase [Prevotella sp.]|nr:acyltransferase [Prevotella sp.]MBQ6209873.1 acyltransferase [Prevotella sp.]